MLRQATRRALQLQPALTRRTLSTNTTPLSVLVIDGYSKDGRADLQAGGASTAGVLYQQLLKKCTPRGNVVADIVYPADEDFLAPDLSKVSPVDGGRVRVVVGYARVCVRGCRDTTRRGKTLTVNALLLLSTLLS